PLIATNWRPQQVLQSGVKTLGRLFGCLETEIGASVIDDAEPASAAVGQSFDLPRAAIAQYDVCWSNAPFGRSFEMNGGNLPARGEEAQLGESQHPLGRFGDLAETIAQFLAEILQSFQPTDACQPAIHFHALSLTLNKIAGEKGGPGKIDRRLQ